MTFVKKSLPIFFGLIILSYICVKTFLPAIFESYYPSASVTPEPPSFYQGEVDKHIIGPVAQVLAALFLVLLCFYKIEKLSFLKFSFVIFIFLMIFKWETILFPPYADTLLGPFSDAIYLLRHKFDYWLYWHQPNFNMGGPKVYPTSIYPSFLALLMVISPSSKVFLILIHLITFFMASLIVATFREIIKTFSSARLATLLAVGLLFFPLFQSMTELINMEMACTLFAVLSVYFITRKDIRGASLCAIASILIKAPGIIVCLTVLAASIFFYMFDKSFRARRLDWLWPVIAFIIALILAKLTNAVNNASYNHLEFMVGWILIKFKKFFWGFLVLATLFCLGLIWQLVKGKKNYREVVQENFLAGIVFLISALWFFIYLNFTALLARYELLLLPFFILCIVFVGRMFIKNEKFWIGAAVIFIFIGAFGSYGVIFDQNTYGASGNISERSLEYRNDLRLHMAVAKDIEKNFDQIKVGAPPVLAQALNFREVGYVTKRLNVIMYGAKSQHEDIPDFHGFIDTNPNQIVWLALKVDVEPHNKNYPISPKDQILKTYRLGTHEAYLFKGGFGIEERRLLIELKVRGLI